MRPPSVRRQLSAQGAAVLRDSLGAGADAAPPPRSAHALVEAANTRDAVAPLVAAARAVVDTPFRASLFLF